MPTEQTTAPPATRRAVWLQLHNLIVERSLPVPAQVNLTERHSVWLAFDSGGEAKRWAASCGWVESPPGYTGQLDGWPVYVMVGAS